MDREQLLCELTALDFMAVDLHLYLDTHPHDREALDKYNQIVGKANKLRAEYENEVGPLFSYRSMSDSPWEWIEDPWPWQSSFNFRLSRGGIN